MLTDQLHVMHNFEACDLDADGQSEIITASYEGVTWLRSDDTGQTTLQRLDADQELIIGVRDDQAAQFRCGLRIYDPVDADSGSWARTLVDPGGVAIEDLAVGDLDSDGDQDIVAVGRATHNVKIYWNQRQP